MCPRTLFYCKEGFHLIIIINIIFHVHFLVHCSFSVSLCPLLSAIVHLLVQINVYKNMRTAGFLVVCGLPVFIILIIPYSLSQCVSMYFWFTCSPVYHLLSMCFSTGLDLLLSTCCLFFYISLIFHVF